VYAIWFHLSTQGATFFAAVGKTNAHSALSSRPDWLAYAFVTAAIGVCNLWIGAFCHAAKPALRYFDPQD
jgi:hypothetical protein